ncbi:MAG: N-acetylmuramoyl-L-alanine amidase [Beijerinckiaceae bacterium]|nr:N-acetylmuramoyl-L-alanine amidase [Beijerinckiaceae bacterium]
MLIEAPDCPLVNELRPSPNHGERIGCVTPDMILLHYTGAPAGEARAAWLRDPGGQALDWLANPLSCVSAHYLIHEDGRIVQLVSEARRAWHAGAASWGGESDINSRSVGVEIVNLGHEADLPQFPLAQVEAVIALCRSIASRNGVRPERVLAHSDVAPGRKVDPGERFPWSKLAKAGVGLWRPEAESPPGARAYCEGDEGQPVRALQAMLALFGYGVQITGVFDAQTRAVVEAFQRHWRTSRVDGIADGSTIATLRALIEARGALKPAVA